MPCLLLDVDGVILRDRLLLSHVSHNASKYLSNKLPKCTNAPLLNRQLYMAHGHTARGLQSVFRVDSSDYNEKVYDKSLMTHLADVLGSKNFRYDAEVINNMILQGWPVTLFSNAPYCWVDKVARAISDKVKVRCPGPILSVSHLKPDIGFYREFDECTDYYFVDDSLKNLGTVRKMNNWYPIYFNEDYDPSVWCPQISSIRELHTSILGYNIPGQT